VSTLEDQVRRTLAQLDEVPTRVGSLEQVRRQARVSGRRRRTLAVVASSALVAVVAFSAHALDTGDHAAPRPPSHPVPADGEVSSWARVGVVPLSRRYPSIVAGVAGRLVVFGGIPPHYCEGMMSCPAPRPLHGGAVFDPATATWTPMSRPPEGLSDTQLTGRDYAIDGTRLLMLTNRLPIRVVSYDVVTDRWQVLPTPPVPLHGNDMIAGGRGQVYVADQDDREGRPQRGRIERLDLQTMRWTLLPSSTFRPRLSVRAMVVTPAGLLVDGLYGLDPDDTRYQAEVERFAQGRWHRYPSPRGMQAAGYSFSWDGARLVAPFAANRSRGGALDPSAGTWVRYPLQPNPDAVGWQLGFGAARGFVLRGGLVFDVDRGTSRVVRRPAGGDDEAVGTIIGHDLYVVDARSVLWRAAL
jgi:hypothetical protein